MLFVSYALQRVSRTKHSTQTECFVQEQPRLNKITAEFDGYVEKSIRVSTCLIRIGHHKQIVVVMINYGVWQHEHKLSSGAEKSQSYQENYAHIS